MDIATLIGIIGGILFIVVGIVFNGSIADFFDPASVMIVLGGTIAATLINYPLSRVIRIFALIRNAFISRGQDIEAGIDRILQMAMIARKDGLLMLENQAEELEDPFVKKGILLIVDGTSPELVKNMLETELAFLEDRHKQGQGILESMGAYAPAFGMIGTLIGLITMLKNLNEPSTLGPSMAVALVTTFYGVILANLVFMPLAGKLKNNSLQELLYKEIMLEGILSIQAGENPRIIEEKLRAFVTRSVKKAAAGPAEEVEAYDA